MDRGVLALHLAAVDADPADFEVIGEANEKGVRAVMDRVTAPRKEYFLLGIVLTEFRYSSRYCVLTVEQEREPWKAETFTVLTYCPRILHGYE